MADGQPQVDLTAGLVPKAPQGIDLSAGMVQKEQWTPPAEPVQPPGFMQTLGEELGGVAQSFNPASIARGMYQSFAAPAAPMQAIEQIRQDPTFQADPYAWALRKAPEAIGQIAGTAIAGKAIPAVLPAAGRAAGRVAELVDPTRALSEAELLTKALPFNPEKAADMTRISEAGGASKMQTAVDTLKQWAANTGTTIDSAQNLNSSIARAQKTIWETYKDRYLSQVANDQVSTDLVANNIRSTVDPRMTEQRPSMARRTGQIADTYAGKQMTIQQIEDRLKSVNQELDPFSGRKPEQQYAALANPNTARLEAEREGLRDVLYQHLNEAYGPDAVNLRRQWGVLEDLSPYARQLYGAGLKAPPESLLAKGVAMLSPKEAARQLQQWRFGSDQMIKQVFGRSPFGAVQSPWPIPQRPLGELPLTGMGGTRQEPWPGAGPAFNVGRPRMPGPEAPPPGQMNLPGVGAQTEGPLFEQAHPVAPSPEYTPESYGPAATRWMRDLTEAQIMRALEDAEKWRRLMGPQGEPR